MPGQEETYELQWGPLSNEDANKWMSKNTSESKNGRKHTLVVNDIDRFFPPLADWIHNNFKFLPNWRMDDGQISLAEDMGGIGAHVDNYDVFLIQMHGSRRWQVGNEKLSAKTEMDRLLELDVRILKEWGKDAECQDWILNPGDLLYLPPRIGKVFVFCVAYLIVQSLS
jgi:50S ribosomal protein L16 3-hydroxylase